MTSKELKAYIYENDKIYDILEGIGMHSIVMRERYITCGFPDGDNQNACTIYNNEYFTIRSYTREITNDNGMKPDIVDLVRFVLDLKTSYDSLKEILKLSGLSGKISANTSQFKDGTEIFKKAKRKNAERELHGDVFDRSILENYDKTPHIDLMTKDWITPKFAKMYDIVFDEESGRIIFPHFKWDNHNEILALVGRTVNPAFKELKIPKYLTVLGVGYRKENNIYGLSLNMGRIKEVKKVIVFEAEKSVIKAHQCGYGYSVSVGCHDISMQQIKILLSLGVEEIILAFDKDVPLEHVKKYYDLLSAYVKVTIIYDIYDVLSEKDSPIDKGMKMFNWFYNNRKTLQEIQDIIDKNEFIKIQ